MEYDDFDAYMRELMNNSKGNCTPLPEDFFDKMAESAKARQDGVSAAYGVICAIGLIANIIVMFLLLTGGKKGATFKAPSTILIMNLAVADTLLLLTLPFAISHRLHKGWKFGNAMCKFEEGVKFLNYYGSVFFITAMAVDRYLVVSRPSFLNRKLARKYMLIVSGVLWSLALIAVLPLLIFAGVDEYGFCSIRFPRDPKVIHDSSAFAENHDKIECIEEYFYYEPVYYEGADAEIVHVNDTGNDEQNVSVDYTKEIYDALGISLDDVNHVTCKHPEIRSLHAWLIWNFIIGFVVPFFIISICYARMMMLQLPVVSYARDHATENNNVSREIDRVDITYREDVSKLIDQVDSMNNKKRISQRAKILMNVLVPCLIAAFAICWMPYHVFHLLQINGIKMSSDNACHVTRDITFCLAFFNSALNPILNSFFLYSFRQRLHESKTWVSNQLKCLTKKKKNAMDATYANGLANGSGHGTECGLAGEATEMTSTECVDENVLI